MEKLTIIAVANYRETDSDLITYTLSNGECFDVWCDGELACDTSDLKLDFDVYVQAFNEEGLKLKP
jgi:hypothetical protein